MAIKIVNLLDELIEKKADDSKIRIIDTLKDFPKHKQEISDLLQLVNKIQRLRYFSLSSRIVAQKWENLMPRLREQPVTFKRQLSLLKQNKLDKFFHRRFEMIKMVMSMGLIILVLFSGFSSVDAAGPGDLLYPLDRSIEALQLSLASDPVEILSLRLAQAADRLEEFEDKLSTQDIANALLAIESYQNEIILLTEWINTPEASIVSVLFAELNIEIYRHQEVLKEILENAPPEAKTAIQKAIDVSLNALHLPELPDNIPPQPEIPTELPTIPPIPTAVPTELPTIPPIPTTIPTELPTLPPEPTTIPTELPTLPPEPTTVPTELPVEPTLPTFVPTELPTEPTLPTSIPTELTLEPTLPQIIPTTAP